MDCGEKGEGGWKVGAKDGRLGGGSGSGRMEISCVLFTPWGILRYKKLGGKKWDLYLLAASAIGGRKKISYTEKNLMFEPKRCSTRNPPRFVLFLFKKNDPLV